MQINTGNSPNGASLPSLTAPHIKREGSGAKEAKI